MQATFSHGNPVMGDWTPPTTAINTGDVLVINAAGGWTCGIAHHDVPVGTVGALASGDGIYNVKNINNAANGAKVWWDATNQGVTTTSTGNALFGFITSGGGGGANSQCKARHMPLV